MDTKPKRNVPPEQIALAAYYNAERRGFAGNQDVNDWLDAERVLQLQLHDRVENSQEAASSTIAQEDLRAKPEDLPPDKVTEYAKKLEVSAESVRAAVQRVGPNTSEVQEYLYENAENQTKAQLKQAKGS